MTDTTVDYSTIQIPDIEVQRLFPVMAITRQLPDPDGMNERLARLLLGREKMAKSAHRSNLGGWQSVDDIFTWDHPDLVRLHAFFQDTLQKATAELQIPGNLRFTFKAYGWANINHAGDSNQSHVHPGSTWSSAYYVDAGDEDRPEGDGDFMFTNPDAASVMSFFPDILPSTHYIRPRTGMLVMFPSYVPHSVMPYHGKRARISIAINAHGGILRE